MRNTSAYKLKDRYFVYPKKRTSEGVWLASEDFVSLPLHASVEDLGNAVLGALAQSHGVLPHPEAWAGLSKPRLSAAGVRSEKAFMQGARLVEVTLMNEMILTPTRNGGASGEQRGFAQRPDSDLNLPADSSPTEVGQALLAAFGHCSTT